jgi:hypothetical protein
MPNKGKFIGGQDNLFVPDAPTIGTATAGEGQLSITFTAPSDVGGDAVTLYGASVFLAGATINYRVSVGTGTLSTGGSGNVYFIDGIPTKQLSLIKGFTYVFDLSDSSNSGHPFGFKNASDGAYTTGVTTSGTAGSASATVTLVLATDASEPSRYYCTSHGNGMGNTISLIEASASTDPLGAAQAGTTGSSSPITVTGLSNGTSYIVKVWAINDYGNGPLSSASGSVTPAAVRALTFGGNDGSSISNVVDYFAVSTTGNATDFGDLSAGRMRFGAVHGSTRALVGGGATDTGGTKVNIIEYFTIASTGNATDFGDMAATIRGLTGSINNSTRGVWTGGYESSRVNRIQYVTVASTGNTSDFGDLTEGKGWCSNASSSTKGFTIGGENNSAAVNVIETITTASTGNSSDFGDSTIARSIHTSGSNSTRAITAGGVEGTNVIDYFTMASAGNAVDFGNAISESQIYGQGTAENETRLCLCGGHVAGSISNIIQYITIASTGDAQDFGDLTVARSRVSSASNGGGGLS